MICATLKYGELGFWHIGWLYLVPEEGDMWNGFLEKTVEIDFFEVGGWPIVGVLAHQIN
jgi:hypothetical protein